MQRTALGVIAVLALLGTGTDLVAQKAKVSPQPRRPAATDAPTRPQPQPPKLNGPEQLKQAEKAVASIRGALSTVLRLLSTARREKDLVRLNCVREKLISVKGLLRVAEQASVTLQEAVSGSDKSLAQYEFQRIGIAATKTAQIEVEAKSCVGEVAVYTGPVQVLIDIDPEIPRKDPTLLPDPRLDLDTLPDLQRPFALSPAF